MVSKKASKMSKKTTGSLLDNPIIEMSDVDEVTDADGLSPVA